MAARLRVARDNSGSSLQEFLLEAVQGGTVLVGKPAQLAASLDVTVSELRATLRTLLEDGKVAVWAESSGRISIRLERRRPLVDPLLPPAVERRRPVRDALPDLWII